MHVALSIVLPTSLVVVVKVLVVSKLVVILLVPERSNPNGRSVPERSNSRSDAYLPRQTERWLAIHGSCPNFVTNLPVSASKTSYFLSGLLLGATTRYLTSRQLLIPKPIMSHLLLWMTTILAFPLEETLGDLLGDNRFDPLRDRFGDRFDCGPMVCLRDCLYRLHYEIIQVDQDDRAVL